MELIDFDQRFTEHLNDWIAKNQCKYKRPEEMEDAMPDVYLRWLNQKADWLGGKTPGEYFTQYDDAQALVELMVAYISSDISVPDPLLDRIAELGEGAQAPLMALLTDRSKPQEARMTAVSLLRQVESRAPMVDYIRWQVEREEDEELLDSALESLHEMGKDVVKPIMIAFAAADDSGKEALLDVLADYPVEDSVFQFALRIFKQTKDRKALYAGYLGKMDDDRALEALCDAAEAKDVSYIDFIEIRNAIERLGGEAPIRDFQNDPTYQAVRRLQER